MEEHKITREDIISRIERGCIIRRDMSAREMLSLHRQGKLEDAGELYDLLALADLLAEDDPIFQSWKGLNGLREVTPDKLVLSLNADYDLVDKNPIEYFDTFPGREKCKWTGRYYTRHEFAHNMFWTGKGPGEFNYEVVDTIWGNTAQFDSTYGFVVLKHRNKFYAFSTHLVDAYPLRFGGETGNTTVRQYYRPVEVEKRTRTIVKTEWISIDKTEEIS